MAARAIRARALSLGLGSAVLSGAWLFLTVMPALADGGPHVAAANSGVSTLAADGCAGCHRAHTAQGEMLLVAADEEGLCLSCHGAAGAGATTDVEDGVQYALGAGGLRGGTEAGALRSGGFVEARIDSTDSQRISYPRLQGGGISTWFSSNVKALAVGPAGHVRPHRVPGHGGRRQGRRVGQRRPQQRRRARRSPTPARPATTRTATATTGSSSHRRATAPGPSSRPRRST